MQHMPQAPVPGKKFARKSRRSPADRHDAYRPESPSIAALRLSRKFGLSVPVASLVATLAGLLPNEMGGA